MIQRACGWLEQHIEGYYLYDAWIGDYIDADALIKDFKKHLED